MGIFGFFRRKKKLDTQVHDSLKAIFDKIKKYKNITKEELVSLPDEDLAIAAISWMEGKFNDDWSNQFDVIESLPKSCRDVYGCSTVVAQVNNGGLNQLFFNYPVKIAIMAQEGFSALGNEKLSGIMKAAVGIYESNIELIAKYDDGTTKSFCESYNEKLFDELDEAFFQEEPEADSLMRAYIRKNQSDFGN